MVGKSLGHYEILAPLGSGGMGDVYRAHDASLNREVAIKVLPEDLADDPDRLARLKREAHLLAALNHPNVATIHGFEESDSTRFLVMELVKGESLEQRLAGGRLPVDEALDICRQIAEALEAAHDEGIVHRDLKPANVLITPDGRAKVLDFGLAKTTETTEPSDVDISHSPTLTVAGTKTGVILGTAPYMSPEQVRGKPVDKRADIWAFGCVLYETLTGSRAFNRETVADTLAAILEVDPPWEALPRDTPPIIRALLLRCLRKNPRRRLHDIADARIELEEALEAPAGVVVPGVPGGERLPAGRPVLPWTFVAAALVVAAGVVLWAALSATPGGHGPVAPWHYVITPPEGTDRFGSQIAISADGSTIAFYALGDDGSGGREWQIYTQVLGQVNAALVPGTSDLPLYQFFNSLFLSPDGRSLGFATGEAIYRVDLDNPGQPRRICDAPGNGFRGASWGPNDTIVYAPATESGLVQISASTVPCSPVGLTTGDPSIATYQSHRLPHYLPGGHGLLYSRRTRATGRYGGETVLLDLQTRQETRLLDGMGAVYVEPGYLVLGQHDFLVAAPFDLESLTLLADNATPLPGMGRGEVDYRSLENQARFAASRTGDLIFLPARPPGTSTLALTASGGARQLLDLNPPVGTSGGTLSPDGTKLLHTDNYNIWVYSMDPPGPGRELGFVDSISHRAIWTPDSESIVFASTHEGPEHIYIQAADGNTDPQLLIETWNGQPRSFSEDGEILLYAEGGATGSWELWTYNRDRQEAKALVPGYLSAISPDGRYFAHQASGPTIQVSTIPDARFVTSWPGRRPRWDVHLPGLVFQQGDAWFMAPVKPGADIEFDALVSIPSPSIGVIADGRTLTVDSTTPAHLRTEIHVILNFHEWLKEQMQTGR